MLTRMRRLLTGLAAVTLAVLAMPSANATLPGTNGKIAFTSLRDGN
jgi:hypothetical protein